MISILILIANHVQMLLLGLGSRVLITMRSNTLPGDLMDMESAEFDEEFSITMQTCKVAESVPEKIFFDKQYTSSALFAFAFISDSALEEFIQFVGTLHDDPPYWSSSSEASSIRHLHHCCTQATKNPAHHPASKEDPIQPEHKSGQRGSCWILLGLICPPPESKKWISLL